MRQYLAIIVEGSKIYILGLVQSRPSSVNGFNVKLLRSICVQLKIPKHLILTAFIDTKTQFGLIVIILDGEQERFGCISFYQAWGAVGQKQETSLEFKPVIELRCLGNSRGVLHKHPIIFSDKQRNRVSKLVLDDSGWLVCPIYELPVVEVVPVFREIHRPIVCSLLEHRSKHQLLTDHELSFTNVVLQGLLVLIEIEEQRLENCPETSFDYELSIIILQ